MQMERAAIIPRPEAVKWMQRWRDRDVIKVVTGLRRCGKSTVLRLAQRAFMEAGVSETSIIALDLEKMGFDAPSTPRELYELAVSQFSEPRSYVFIDEPQRVPGFERAVDALYSREDCDVYITGSNSDLLSSELHRPVCRIPIASPFVFRILQSISRGIRPHRALQSLSRVRGNAIQHGTARRRYRRIP